MADRLSALDASFLYLEQPTMPDVHTLATLIEESLDELLATVPR